MARGGVIISILVSIVAFFILVPVTLAQDTPQNLLLNKPDLQIEFPNLELTESEKITIQGKAPGQYYVIPWIAEYIKGVYQFGVAAAVVLAVAMVVFGGFVWMTAGGNANQVTTAKGYIMGAVTGIVLALGSYSILYLVNPNLTKLSPLRVPIIGRIGLGAYCSPIVQSGEKFFQMSGNPPTPTPLELGATTTCNKFYQKTEQPDGPSDYCLGSSCGSSQLCVPTPKLHDVNFGQTLAGQKLQHQCQSTTNVRQVCNAFTEKAIKDLGIPNLEPNQTACNLINQIPGVLEQGSCAYFNKSASLGGDDGCAFCSAAAYAGLVPAFDAVAIKAPYKGKDDLCDTIVDDEWYNTGMALISDSAPILAEQKSKLGLQTFELEACAIIYCRVGR